jgi:hypothetical protein
MNKIMTFAWTVLGFSCLALAWLWETELEPAWPIVPFFMIYLSAYSLMAAMGMEIDND